jgi:uncharacterized membrane protein
MPKTAAFAFLNAFATLKVGVKLVWWVMSPLMWMLSLISVSLISGKYAEARYKTDLRITAVVMSVGFLIFSAGLMVLYMYTFRERVLLPSFERYMNCYLSAWTLVTIGGIAVAWRKNVVTRPNIYLTVVPLIALAVLVFITQRAPLTAERATYKRLAQELSVKLSPVEKVYIISEDSDAATFYQMRYELAPILTNKNAADLTQSAPPSELGRPHDDPVRRIYYVKTQMPPKVWAAELADYSHILVLHSNSEFVSNYLPALGVPHASAGDAMVLYRLVNTAGKIKALQEQI